MDIYIFFYRSNESLFVPAVNINIGGLSGFRYLILCDIM